VTPAGATMLGMGGRTADMGVISPLWLPLLLIVPAAAAYALGVVRLTRRGDRWPTSRSAAAATGFAVLTAACMPPLATSMSFEVHVSQHLLLTMGAPLALALGAPVTLALRTLPPAARRPLLRAVHSQAARALTLAPIILLLDVGGMYIYYLTPLYAASHALPWLHAAIDAHMFSAGFLLSWYVIGRDPMPRRPSTRTALAVLVIAGASHDVLSKLMYGHLLPRGGGAPDHIRAGAEIMFYGGDAADAGMALAVMIAWYARSGRQLAHDRRRASPVPRPRLARAAPTRLTSN
jgi:putative membrane protein